jgi:C4-dicarboxylate-specific signal transduction histidine kinase
MTTEVQRGFPTRSFAFGLLLTTALIGIGSWNAWRLYTGMKALATGQLRLTQLDGVIVHLDEVLTMSARMAAVTGDSRWQARYQQYVPALDMAIQEVLGMAPDLRAKSYSQQTDAANKALVEMELAAFAHARAGERAEASGLLFGPEYEAQKKIYAAGMASTMNEATRRFDEKVTSHGRRVMVMAGVGAALFLLLIGVWLRIALLIRGHLSARNQAEAALVETNEMLEGRVAVRTAELSEALASLELNHSSLTAAHESLESLHRELATRDRLSSLGLLAAGIAHEINNPMTFVTSNVSSLVEDMRETEGLPGTLRDYVDDILPETLEGIRRVNAIVADLRRFARGDIDGMVEYDLNAEVAAAVRMSRTHIKDGCRIELELGAIPALFGRPRQIAQTAINLVVNAAQAIEGKSGIITVATRGEPAGAVLVVRDDGIGMSADTLARLFQPFFTTKPVGQGTGLGLSVAWGIVKAHGGTIEVDSEVGRGTEFVVRLPYAPPTAMFAAG